MEGFCSTNLKLEISEQNNVLKIPKDFMEDNQISNGVIVLFIKSGDKFKGQIYKSGGGIMI